MYQDPDFPIDMADNYFGGGGEGGEPVFESTFSELQGSSGIGGGRSSYNPIISGTGTYAEKLNKINSLDKKERANARAALAADYFNIRDVDGILNIVAKFPQIEYKNMSSLVGAIQYYNQYGLAKKGSVIHQVDLASFYKNNSKMAGEIAIEDLLRYIRLAVNVLNKRVGYKI